MVNFSDSDYSLYPAQGGGVTIEDETKADDMGTEYKARGIIESPHGMGFYYAYRYTNSNGKSWEHSSVEFIQDGRKYHRRFEKAYRPQYLVGQGKKFIKELWKKKQIARACDIARIILKTHTDTLKRSSKP